MYKVASDNKQRVLHQGRPSDWANGEENLSLKDRFELKQNEARFLEGQIKGLPGKSEARRELGLRKLAVQNELKEMRPALNKQHQERRTFGDVFIEIAREQLSPVQYKILRNATLREYDRRQQEGEITQTTDTGT